MTCDLKACTQTAEHRREWHFIATFRCPSCSRLFNNVDLTRKHFLDSHRITYSVPPEQQGQCSECVRPFLFRDFSTHDCSGPTASTEARFRRFVLEALQLPTRVVAQVPEMLSKMKVEVQMEKRFIETTETRLKAMEKRFEAMEKQFEAMKKQFEAMQALLDDIPAGFGTNLKPIEEFGDNWPGFNTQLGWMAQNCVEGLDKPSQQSVSLDTTYCGPYHV
ncbi:hypothetical protein GE09DRAFT_1236916 [Coniochaeta sp. 2T2.1]|nr:hypothetical protein GE09DRAFT_1236916 [Coniochaeta sp. 2T2.1]